MRKKSKDVILHDESKELQWTASDCSQCKKKTTFAPFWITWKWTDGSSHNHQEPLRFACKNCSCEDCKGY